MKQLNYPPRVGPTVSKVLADVAAANAKQRLDQIGSKVLSTIESAIPQAQGLKTADEISEYIANEILSDSKNRILKNLRATGVEILNATENAADALYNRLAEKDSLKPTEQKLFDALPNIAKKLREHEVLKMLPAASAKIFQS